jgi:hypothetical protein
LVRRPLIGLLYQPRLIDDECGAFGGMRIGRGNRSTRKKPAPVPLCPPQIPHDLGSNPGHRGGKPATNRLSYGTTDSNLMPRSRTHGDLPPFLQRLVTETTLTFYLFFHTGKYLSRRSQWPRGLRHELSSLARKLES